MLALKLLICIIILPATLSFPFAALTPIVAAAFFGLYEKVQDVSCMLGECCRDAQKLNLTYALKELKRNVFGQNVAVQTILTHIKAHTSTDNPKRPLVLSLHGPTGTGKNHVSSILANSLYKSGMKSNFVKKYDATLDFQRPDRIQQNKQRLQDELKNALYQCSKCLFIFDEMDKIPSPLIEVLIPFLGFAEDVHGRNHRTAIFLLLGNTGASDISNYLHSFIDAGGDRDMINLKNLNRILLNSSYYSPGGFDHSDLIKKHLITASIPFLPLEKDQVTACIHAEANAIGFSISDFTVNEILSDLDWFPPDTQRFSISGCKHIFEMVRFHQELYKQT